MSAPHFKPLPSQADCKRCLDLFVYFRTTRPRFYCAPCIELERQDALAFYKQLRAARLQAPAP